MQSNRPIYPKFPRLALLIFATSISLASYSQEQQGDTSLFYSMLSMPDAQTSLNYALLTAAVNGDTVQIWWLIRYGADIDTKTLDNITPLIYAVANNKIDAAKLLLNNGSDPNARTNLQETPLLLAVKNNNVDMAEFLIRDSADIRFADRYGVTSLHYAAVYGYFYMADMLIYYDAEVSRRSGDGTTPLMAAIWSGSSDVADLLLQNNAKAEEKDYNGFTPFLIAAQNGDTVMMELLLKRGANMYELNKYNYNALDLCIKVNAEGAVKYLLRKGDKWGEAGRNQVSPYSVAAIYRREKTIELLKEYKVPGSLKRGFDQVSVSASIVNCIFDYYTGLSVSLREPSHNLGIIAGIDFKPGYTRVMMKQNEMLFYQYYDKSAVAYAGILKDFRLTDNPLGGNWFITCTLSAGYAFGNKLKGTEIVPGDKFKIKPAAGIKWSKGAFSIDADLEYMNTDYYKIGPVWLRAGISWSFYFDNARAPGKVINWY